MAAAYQGPMVGGQRMADGTHACEVNLYWNFDGGNNQTWHEEGFESFKDAQKRAIELRDKAQKRGAKGFMICCTRLALITTDSLYNARCEAETEPASWPLDC